MVMKAGDVVCTFRIECPDVQQVYLVGDFNNWSIPGVPMTEVEAGMWEARLRLPPGDYQVGYYVINWRWNSDQVTEDKCRRGYELMSGRWVGDELTVSV